MIEDVEITRRILELYANENEFPSSIGMEELMEALPDIPRNVLEIHIVWANDSGMFLGRAYLKTNIAYGGTEYTILTPDGLSKEGSDYVKYAQTSLWDKAKDMAQEKSVPLTTQLLARILPKLAEKFLGD